MLNGHQPAFIVSRAQRTCRVQWCANRRRVWYKSFVVNGVPGTRSGIVKSTVTRFDLDDPEWRELLAPELDAWLNSWPAEMLAQYGGRYVAVNRDRQVVAADTSASRLQRTLAKLGATKVRVFYQEKPDVHVVYPVRA
jgi:hypothetical protein